MGSARCAVGGMRRVGGPLDGAARSQQIFVRTACRRRTTSEHELRRTQQPCGAVVLSHRADNPPVVDASNYTQRI